MTKENLISSYPQEPSLFTWYFFVSIVVCLALVLLYYNMLFNRKRGSGICGIVLLFGLLILVVQPYIYYEETLPKWEAEVHIWEKKDLPLYAKTLPADRLEILSKQIHLDKAIVSFEDNGAVTAVEADFLIVSEDNKDRFVVVTLNDLSDYGVPEGEKYYIMYASKETLSGADYK